MQTEQNIYTETEQTVIDGLRSKGFVVVIWTPDEVGEANPDVLEDITISRGNDYLSETN